MSNIIDNVKNSIGENKLMYVSTRHRFRDPFLKYCNEILCKHYVFGFPFIFVNFSHEIVFGEMNERKSFLAWSGKISVTGGQKYSGCQ